MNLSEPLDDDRYDEPVWRSAWCAVCLQTYQVASDDPHAGCPQCDWEAEEARAALTQGAA
jgi:hypothetical protein